LDGFICVDKPTGPSSFAVTNSIRKVFKTKKAGHAGTLDPMASGLLLIALGNCTRLLQYLNLEPKVYEFSIKFGQSTDTLDAEGSVTASSSVYPSRQQLIDIIKQFIGEQKQLPPVYSAIKIGGKPAYKFAREGVDLELKPRSITIFSLELSGYVDDGTQADFVVSCSSGTYVRSLARDIVKEAGAEGFVNKLRRTQTGLFDVAQSVDYQNLEKASNYIIPPHQSFHDSQKVILSGGQKTAVFHGKDVELDCERSEDLLIAFDRNNELTAVLRKADEKYHPERVFHSVNAGINV
jgi:tRNA pseudouridine55 synthase